MFQQRKKANSPHRYIPDFIGEFFQRGQINAAGGRAKIRLLVQHDFSVGDSVPARVCGRLSVQFLLMCAKGCRPRVRLPTVFHTLHRPSPATPGDNYLLTLSTRLAITYRVQLSVRNYSAQSIQDSQYLIPQLCIVLLSP